MLVIGLVPAGYENGGSRPGGIGFEIQTWLDGSVAWMVRAATNCGVIAAVFDAVLLENNTG